MEDLLIEFILGGLAAVGGFAGLATMTKNGSTNPTIDKVLKAINFLGANWGRAANKMIVLCAVGVSAMMIGCANTGYTQEDCREDIELAEALAIEILSEELSDEEKARKAALYAKIVGRLAQRGCAFVPPTEPEPEVPELLRRVEPT